MSPNYSQYCHKYKELVRHILETGTMVDSRNSKTISIPHYSFTIDNMQDDHKLLLRKMYYKGVKGEFKTLVSNVQLMNVSQFEDNGCNYWDSWADEKGNLNLDYYNELHPALENMIDQIRRDPESRRHVISLWNNDHVQNDSLSLPCCWHNLTFTVVGRVLHLTWSQRSVDTMIGLPSDVYLAYLFMKHVAQSCALEIGSCMFALSNVHVYEPHVENAVKLLDRTTDYEDVPLKFELIS